MNKLTLAITAGLLLIAGFTPTFAATNFPSTQLQAGILLVAKPHMSDKRFTKVVILLFQYSAQGAWGIVVNKPSRINLADAYPDNPVLETLDNELFLGGPVAPQKRFILIKDKQPPSPQAKSLGQGLYLSGSPTLLTELAKQTTPRRPFRVIAGYAGWDARQLDKEVAHGDWIVQPMEAASILETEPEKLWQLLIDLAPMQLAAHTPPVTSPSLTLPK